MLLMEWPIFPFIFFLSTYKSSCILNWLLNFICPLHCTFFPDLLFFKWLYVIASLLPHFLYLKRQAAIFYSIASRFLSLLGLFHTRLYSFLAFLTKLFLICNLFLDTSTTGFPGGTSWQYRRHKTHRFYPWARKIPWRSAWQPTPVLVPGESHGQRGLAGYSPQGRKESDTTEVT